MGPQGIDGVTLSSISKVAASRQALHLAEEPVTINLEITIVASAIGAPFGVGHSLRLPRQPLAA